MKIKYTGKKVVYLRRPNASIKLTPGKVFEGTELDKERFKDRKDFEIVKVKQVK
jgi:hypothetical protein